MNPIRLSFPLMFAAAFGLANAESSSPSAEPVPAPTQPTGVAAQPVTPGPVASPASQAGQPGIAAEPSEKPSAAPTNMQSAAKALLEKAKSNNKPLDKEQVGNWIASLHKLFDESSSAQQIAASDNVQAKALHAEARALHQEAKKVFDSGDIVKPQEMLNKAAVSFIQAAQMLAPKPDPAKLKAQLDARIAEVRVLFETYKSSVGEKPTSDVAATLRGIEQALSDAARHSASVTGVQDGRVAADKALLLTRAASGGEPKDASVEERYRHAMERNEIHQFLVRLLLSEKRSVEGLDPTIEGDMKKASALRAQADTSAEDKKYGDAIKTLDGSTLELISVVRKLGVALPK